MGRGAGGGPPGARARRAASCPLPSDVHAGMPSAGGGAAINGDSVHAGARGADSRHGKGRKRGGEASRKAAAGRSDSSAGAPPGHGVRRHQSQRRRRGGEPPAQRAARVAWRGKSGGKRLGNRHAARTGRRRRDGNAGSGGLRGRVPRSPRPPCPVRKRTANPEGRGAGHALRSTPARRPAPAPLLRAGGWDGAPAAAAAASRRPARRGRAGGAAHMAPPACSLAARRWPRPESAWLQ